MISISISIINDSFCFFTILYFNSAIFLLMFLTALWLITRLPAQKIQIPQQLPVLTIRFAAILPVQNLILRIAIPIIFARKMALGVGLLQNKLAVLVYYSMPKNCFVIGRKMSFVMCKVDEREWYLKLYLRAQAKDSGLTVIFDRDRRL